MHLVLLETSGNQNYLFATNRLRENVGASELTYRAGTQFVLEAVAQLGGSALWDDDPNKLRENITKQSLIENADTPIEVIVATSGKALSLVKEKETAEKLISEVTRRALQEMPGLDICGVISEPFKWAKNEIHLKIKEVHKDFEEVRSSRPHPVARFPNLPITALCKTSGLPAYDIDKDGKEISVVSHVKQKTADAWKDRIGKILKGSEYFVVKSIDQLEKHFGTLSWFAVVHADGNGLGKIFLNFEQYSGAKNNRDYVNKLRHFSLALEDATENAFRESLKVLGKLKEENFQRKAQNNKGEILPIVPLVLGGDDLTVICNGEYALEFTRVFLKEFEQQTAREDIHRGIIPQIAQQSNYCPRLSACAGIAITKPHFPFHNSYTLAEELIKQAKTVKERLYISTDNKEKIPYPCSAMDFHVVYDASFTHLSEIRELLKTDKHLAKENQTRLTAKPYVVTTAENLPSAGEITHTENKSNAWICASHLDWVQTHHIRGLLTRIQALLEKGDDDHRQLPNSQVHYLREGLFLGHEEADGRFNLMLKRYPSFKEFLEEDSLFRFNFLCCHENDITCYRETRFLDALEATEFWKDYYREYT